MVEFYGGDGVGNSFPVVFSDGETEIEIGDVTIFPTLDFKRFQSILSQKIGISPHQFSVHLYSPDSRDRIPISDKVNLAKISPEKGRFFVAVLKRSRRRERRRRNSGDRTLTSGGFDPPENVMILKRNTDGVSPALDFPISRAWLAMERDRYLMSMGLNGLGLVDPRFGPNRTQKPEISIPKVLCEECAMARKSGRIAEFHTCVYDPVIFGFRSKSGPIARPYKRSN